MKANFKLKNGSLEISTSNLTLEVALMNYGELDNRAFEELISVLYSLSEYRTTPITEFEANLNAVNLIKNLLNLLPEADRLELINEIKGK